VEETKADVTNQGTSQDSEIKILKNVFDFPSEFSYLLVADFIKKVRVKEKHEE
jgi:hypothetical protein